MQNQICLVDAYTSAESIFWLIFHLHLDFNITFHEVIKPFYQSEIGSQKRASAITWFFL
jgi:hypothetical protein